jgi:hypothetical protein
MYNVVHGKGTELFPVFSLWIFFSGIGSPSLAVQLEISNSQVLKILYEGLRHERNL